jgi:tRNA pseudouridine55 synthase
MGRRRRRAGGPEGLLVVEKVAGVTSHDVVAAARRRLDQPRIGHAGTLDPPATGILLLGVGSFTRTLRFFTALTKRYTGEVVLGSTTTTLDATGEVTAEFDMTVTLEEARAVAATLTGELDQVPPMVSAVRVGGRRLHELARAGEEVDREARRVTVHRFDVEPTAEPGVLSVLVECSSGTYVRSLADDLGRGLGGGAHLRNLRRTAIGSFGEDDAAPVEEAGLLTPAEALRDRDRVVVDDAVADRVRHGAVLGLDELGAEGLPPWVVLDGEGRVLALYEAHGERAKPAVVLAG